MGGNFSLWAYLIIRMRPTFFVPFACMQSHYSDKMCKLAQLHAHWNLHVTRSHRHCAGKIMPNCIILDSRRLYLLRIRIQWNIRQNNAPWHYWDWSFLKSAQRVVISGKGKKGMDRIIMLYCIIAFLEFACQGRRIHPEVWCRSPCIAIFVDGIADGRYLHTLQMFFQCFSPDR